MNVRAPFSSTYTLANLSVLEEVLYDLPPLEGIFLHWHTTGGTALTPGITSLFSQREQMLGSATLPGASMQVLAACASECLHQLPTDELSTAWETRPLHARLLRHIPSYSAEQTQALLPPGALAQKTVTLVLGDARLLCTGAGSRNLSRRERRAMAEALGLPSRASKHGVLNPPPHASVERFGMLPGMVVSPFLSPTRQNGLTALVLLPWPKRWDAQAREVAISLSLWESLLLPLSCLRPLVRLYDGRVYPGIRIIDLEGEEEEETDKPLAYAAVPAGLRAEVHPREVQP